MGIQALAHRALDHVPDRAQRGDPHDRPRDDDGDQGDIVDEEADEADEDEDNGECKCDHKGKCKKKHKCKVRKTCKKNKGKDKCK